MKIETRVDGKIVVKLPGGLFLAVPSMGTTPGQMTVTTSGESVEEVRQRFVEFYDAVATAVWGQDQ